MDFEKLGELFVGISKLLTFRITAWDSKTVLDILAKICFGLDKMFK